MRSPYLVGLLLLSGCASGGWHAGSPEQLRELVKIKDSACTKVTGVYMGATITLTSVSVDKGIPNAHGGMVTITPDCALEIRQMPRQPTVEDQKTSSPFPLTNVPGELWGVYSDGSSIRLQGNPAQQSKPLEYQIKVTPGYDLYPTRPTGAAR